jgi:hypothetical protein
MASSAELGSGRIAAMSSAQAARLSEENVGIVNYVTKQAGFQGTLKYRYKDFLVHEASFIACNTRSTCLPKQLALMGARVYWTGIDQRYILLSCLFIEIFSSMSNC